MIAGWANHVPGACQVDGCLDTVFARGWCSKHYNRWWRNGDPHLRRHRQVDGFIDERDKDTLLDDPDFWEKVEAHQRERLAA